MNISPNEEKLLNYILERTAEGKLTWKEDAEDETYSTAVGGKYTVKANIDSSRTRILKIFNNVGVELFTYEEARTEPPTFIFHIIRAAKKNALGLDKALDEMLSELDKL